MYYPNNKSYKVDYKLQPKHQLSSPREHSSVARDIAYNI
jgi:hypothetical protein